MTTQLWLFCRGCAGVLVAVLAGCAIRQAEAQVGNISGVTYPGWIPSDKVVPTYTTSTTYDAGAGLWRYAYTIANGSSAQQDIIEFLLRFNAPAGTIATAPADWEAVVAPPPGKIPGALFGATLPEVIGTSPNGPAPGQIPPSQSRSGFTLASPYPAGYARSYTRGFANVPYLPANWEETDETNAGVPADTTNSQRRFTLGPIKYTQVVTGGNRRPGVDGFLGFMNLATTGSVVISPAPIALKFSLNGETVFRETFRATLNGTDVTNAFSPGASDGADLVAVFTVGTGSPLKGGKNVLLTSVEGIKAGTTQRATDSDRITFDVDTSGSPTFVSFALLNLPLPGIVISP